ncbi:MAG: hypothetical protein ACI4M8_00195 [Christensenellales bacterium]
MEKLLGKPLWQQIKTSVGIENVNEIRLRVNRPTLIKGSVKEFFLPFIPNYDYINGIIDTATRFSRYAYEREISDGFLEYGDGVRIGLCGAGKINDKKLIAYSSITSLCIRIPHAISGVNLGGITDELDNTLIIGAPYSGKTTLIRAITSLVAEKKDVVVIDERREIAGGGFSLLNAKRADVVQGVPKTEIYEQVIRSMSPSIVVCDELFSVRDFEAVKRICSAGIKCLASFHAKDMRDVPDILGDTFSVIVTLTSNPTPGSISSIVRKNA